MYHKAIAKLATPPLGTPPAQPHVAPAPYDVAQDPGWMAAFPEIAQDHEFRNFINNVSPEERQMLFKRLAQNAREVNASLGQSYTLPTPPPPPPVPNPQPAPAPRQ